MLRKRYHLVFVFLLFLLPFGRYCQILSGYWRWDDTAILLQLLKTPVWKYFCIPKVYQLLSCANFTPWVMLSYVGDLTLFGLNPLAFYLHHLLSLSFIIVAGYYFLSLWVDKKFAFSGMVLFTIGAPVATVIQQLMTRHYLEGLLFAILSLYYVVLFLRRGKNHYLLFGVVFYALAVMAKEIYVPLVCLLPWIPEQTIKVRLKAMLPFVLVVLEDGKGLVGGCVSRGGFHSLSLFAFLCCHLQKVRDMDGQAGSLGRYGPQVSWVWNSS